MKSNFMRFFQLLFLFLFASQSFAQIPENPFKAPLYWSPYEYNIEKEQAGEDGYTPESVWSANIDWMEQNLKPFGYNMICIDGWGDDAKYNEHGYRTTHSSKWQHDYAWWSENLQSRGMTLGMYNNPLWIIKKAADAGVLIKGTNIALSSIMNEGENARWFRWVQVEKPGAEEYVKGYIQYYADMGIKYLRVDFLSWFENGHDRYYGTVGPQRPHAYYETALRWMREACDANGMFLSLVMPHMYNDAATELKYGHMVRINEDAGDGGWYKFSARNRGQAYNGWSKYSNAFDGFVYWSKISGRKKMILDGDFIRINTFANNTEKKTVIAAHLMAGGPVTISDQHNTIGNDLWLYQNEELLALNKDGFVGKPLSDDPTNPASQIWKGQLSNGDWVVGLFNRENSAQIRSIDFAAELGMDGNVGNVRDLWLHNDLGKMKSFMAEIPAHGCMILKVSKDKATQATAPVFSLRPGIYTDNQTVTLSTTTPGAKIYYRTDGATPTTASTLYKNAIAINNTTTLKAIAYKHDLNSSPQVAATYTINKSGPLPSPWETADIGSVAVAGSASYQNGTFTNTASGSDIEGKADAFRYIYQTLAGDGVITAKVSSVTYTNEWTKAGIMLREDLGAGSKNVLLAITPAQRIILQRRMATDEGTSGKVTSATAASVWLRVQRVGNEITGFWSADGISWLQVSDPVTVPMSSTIQAGLAFTSHAEELGFAAFDEVSIATPANSAVIPTFSVAAGTYTTEQKIAISTSTTGAVIHYTLDGTVPNAASPVYTAPLEISTTATVKAIAIAANLFASPIASATYVLPFSSSMYIGGTFNGWSPGKTAMTLKNGIWTATGVAIGSGSQALKFANTPNWSNQDWGNATGLTGTASLTTGGGANISFNIPVAGTYIITFNEVTGAYTITKEIKFSANMYVAGTFSSWNLGNTPMTLINEVWTAKGVQIPAGNQQLKFATKSDWTGNDWGNATGLSGTASPTTGGGGNIVFTAPANGKYTITFNENTLAYAIVSENVITDGTYVIKARHSGKALDVQAGSLNNGALMHQWEVYNNFPSQQWQITALISGNYIIKNVKSGKVLDVVGGSTNEGAGIHQWSAFTNFPSQQWKITATDNGFYKIENIKSGKALDVYGASQSNGAMVNQFTYTGGHNQQWSLATVNVQQALTSVAASSGEVGKDSQATTASIRLSPNPASNLLTVALPAAASSLEIFNSGGIRVYRVNVAGGQHKVKVSSMSSGLYYIRVQVGAQTFIMEKFIVSH